MIRSRRTLLGILAGIIIAVSFTTLGILVGRGAQQAAAPTAPEAHR